LADGEGVDGFGRACDYDPVEHWIRTHLDHSTLVSAEDKPLLAFLKTAGQHHYVTPSNPTPENLAALIHDEALRLGVRLRAVEVCSTCTTSARYEAP
jgi:hypothetical protein